MDRKQFNSAAPGKLVPITFPRGKDWSFIPNRLPPEWDFPAGLWPLLADAKQALGTLNGIGQVLPNPQLLVRSLQNREAITSSSIEGTHVTPKQLLLYELDPHEPTSPTEVTADSEEVSSYGRALSRGMELLKTIPVCKRLVREIHKVLMSGARGERHAPGRFRKCQVQIGSSGKFIPPPHVEVERLLSALEKYIHSDDPKYDPLVRCYLIHYQFEAIHPFRDGNGRVGRVLLALMTAQWHGHALPWLYMSAYFERYRDEYARYLFEVSTKGAWEQWVEFCLRGTLAQANDSIDRCHRFIALRSEFHARVETSSPRTYQLIELLFTTPIVTISWVAKAFGVAYHTAQSDIERLLKAKILHEAPNEYPRTFVAQEVMEIAYGDSDPKRFA